MIFFSNNLRFLRTAKGLKQNDLARELNVKTNTISNYETGVSEPDFKILHRIINIFDVSSFDLLFKDLASQSIACKTYAQIEVQQDQVAETSPLTMKSGYTDNCRNCVEKERIIKAQQITIDELRNDKAYLKEEVKELKKRLTSNQK